MSNAEMPFFKIFSLYAARCPWHAYKSLDRRPCRIYPHWGIETRQKGHFLKEKQIMKSTKAILAGTIFMVVLSASVVIAAETVTGEWNFKSKFDAMTTDATMTITKNADGKYAGTWSSQWGESTLSDITVNAGKVKFTQTSNFGGQDFKTSYEGTLENSKLKGTSKNQYGDATFEGSLSGTAKDDPLVGEWQINLKIPEREIVDKMTITQNQDGTLAGKWEGMRGGENTISNLKFADGKLSFTRTSKMGGTEFSMTFEGTATGDTIKGKYVSDFGEREVTASRAAVKTETTKTEPNKPPAEKK
jgi:hypothetical protein